MYKLISILYSVFYLSFCLNAHADGPRPDQLQVKRLVLNGTGCPAPGFLRYQWRATEDDEADQFVLSQFQMYVERGTGIPITQSRKFCTLSMHIQVPPGWQYRVKRFSWQGFAALPTGYRGVQGVSYKFPQFSQAVYQERIIDGPFEGLYQVRKHSDSGPWSPCRTSVPFHIKNELALQGVVSSRHAVMTSNQVGQALEHIFSLQWRRCRRG